MPAAMAFNYLKRFKALEFIDKNYEAEHLLPLADTLKDMSTYCKRNGGTVG